MDCHIAPDWPVWPDGDGGSMKAAMWDRVAIALMGCFVALFVVAMTSIVLSYVLKLKSPPRARAAWTAGIAYLISVISLMFGLLPEDSAYQPLLAAPGALLMYVYLRWYYQGEWVEDPDNLPAGTTLANDDWFIGLITIAPLLVVVVVRRLLRG